MNRFKLLSGFVAVLITLNSAVLLVFIFQAKDHKRLHFPHRPTEHQKHQMVRDLFSFDDDQMHLFLRSKKDHGDLIYRLSNKQLKLSEAFYDIHKAEASLNEREDILEQLSEINKDIYKANLNHLQDISEICDASQKVYLDSFINNILHKNDKAENKKMK